MTMTKAQFMMSLAKAAGDLKGKADSTDPLAIQKAASDNGLPINSGDMFAGDVMAAGILAVVTGRETIVVLVAVETAWEHYQRAVRTMQAA